MPIIPNGQKFHTVSSTVDTTDRGSSELQSQREIYTMQDIKDSTGPGYKVISQIISQTGTSAPTVNREVENTTGTTFTWQRFGAGIYRLVAADPVFNQGGGNFFYTTTFANIGYPSSPNPIFISTSIQNDILFEINTFDKTGVLTDTGLNFATIEAHIYPVSP